MDNLIFFVRKKILSKLDNYFSRSFGAKKLRDRTVSFFLIEKPKEIQVILLFQHATTLRNILMISLSLWFTKHLTLKKYSINTC